MKKTSHLKIKIFAATVPALIFAILTISASNIILLKSVHSSYKELLEEKSFAVVNNVRRVVNKNLQVFPLKCLSWMSTYISGVVESTDGVSYCFIADKENTVLFHSDEKMAGQKLKANIYTDFLSGNAFSKQTVSVAEYYELIVPIIKTDEIVGSIHLGIEKKLIDSKIFDLFLITAIVLAVSLTVSTTGTALVSSYLASRVNVIKNGLNRIQKDFKYRISPMKGEVGEIVSAINEMAFSLTKRKKLEDQLQRAQRLAAIGEMAAGVAHEIRNPLTSVKGFVQLIGEDLEENDRKLEYIQIVVKEVDRLNKIINELLDYAGSSSLQRVVTDINKVMDNTLLLLNFEAIKPKIHIKKKYNYDLPIIPIDEEQVKQVFLNLVINSTQAIEAEGEITIETAMSKNGKFVKVIIHDTGMGIEEKNIKRIFDPFFTTKERGTGLGLAVVQKIVEMHGGHIEVESRPGLGTTFTVYYCI
ncbi:MAG: ATP-binding protein [Thermodesulfobacteriota bacterium]|nr:ATP-binding protein [Thermodesulfobacteriota bacterium]